MTYTFEEREKYPKPFYQDPCSLLMLLHQRNVTPLVGRLHYLSKHDSMKVAWLNQSRVPTVADRPDNKRSCQIGNYNNDIAQFSHYGNKADQAIPRDHELAIIEDIV